MQKVWQASLAYSANEWHICTCYHRVGVELLNEIRFQWIFVHIICIILFEQLKPEEV